MIEEMEQQQWRVVAGVCETPGGEGASVYGVQVSCCNGTRWQWQDVTDKREAAQQLAALLQEVQPEPCHWADIVEEYIYALSL